MSKQEWPLYEVFIRTKSGLSHRHAGSLHAADDQMALDNARDTYTRRSEGVSLWVVRSDRIVASDPAENSAFFEPAARRGTRERQLRARFHRSGENVVHACRRARGAGA